MNQRKTTNQVSSPNLAGRVKVAHAMRPVVEALEARTLWSFSASLSGLPGASTSTPYTLNVTETGSTSATQEVFHFSGSHSFTQNSPNSPIQSESYTYPTSGVTVQPNADVTPSGGTAFNVPLTLNSYFSSQNVSGKVITTTPGNAGTSSNGVAVVYDGQLGSGGGDFLVLTPYKQTGTGNEEWAVSAWEDDGASDGTWGPNSGVAPVTVFGSSAEDPTGMAFDGTGIYICGNTTNGWAAAKLNESNGLVAWNSSTTGFLSGNATAIVPMSDGGAVVVGNHNGLMTAARLNNTGQLMTTWASSGVRTIQFSTNEPSSASAVVEKTWNTSDVIVGGSSCDPSGQGLDFALAALKVSDGSLDTSWGPNSTGKVTNNFGATFCACSCQPQSTDNLYALSVDTYNSRIIAAGNTNWDNGVAAAAFLDTGLDSGTGGFNHPYGMEAYSIGSSATAYAALVDGDSGDSAHYHDIILGGTAVGASHMSGTSNDSALLRVDQHGNPDMSLGASGWDVTDMPYSGTTPGYDVIKGLAIDSNGGLTNGSNSILGVGQTGATSSGGDLAMAMYLASNQFTVAAGGARPMARLASLAEMSSLPTESAVAAASVTGDPETGVFDGLDTVLGRLHHRALSRR